MELELGLKFTRDVDELDADFKLAKDRGGPLFLSRETESMFILTAHLKGYRRRNIKIDINADGTLIEISGEKQVKETVMMGWKVYKKDIETRAFKKVFNIPDGVILDKIKAKFSEDESTLTITMPKKVKGIRGTAIEEVKESELVKEGSGELRIASDEMPTTDSLERREDQETKEKHEGESNETYEMFTKEDKRKRATEKPEEKEDEKGGKSGSEGLEEEISRNGREEKGLQDGVSEDEVNKRQPIEEEKDRLEHETSPSAQVATSMEEHNGREDIFQVKHKMPKEKLEEKKTVNGIQQETEAKPNQVHHHEESSGLKQVLDQDQSEKDQLHGIPNDVHRENESNVEKPSAEDHKASHGRIDEEGRPSEKGFRICTPVVAGSALLLSLVAFVFQYMRTKNQASKKKE